MESIYNLSPRWIDWAAAVKLRAWLPNILLQISEFVRKSQSEMPNKMKWLKSIKQRTLFLKHKYFLLTVKFCDIDMRSWYMNLKDADIKQNKISDLHIWIQVSTIINILMACCFSTVDKSIWWIDRFHNLSNLPELGFSIENSTICQLFSFWRDTHGIIEGWFFREHKDISHQNL